ncbi:MAG TPA: VWA domain-containing protein [Blastocatellia bacterium]|nr:VWA domain-containing protein [Blastocatellia bacterium]
MSVKPELARLRDEWMRRWPEALALWSKFTKLSEPRWCFDKQEEKTENLSGSFAMIRLNDHAIVISLAQVLDQKLEKFPLEILGHEIGHHVYCPADLSDQGRMIARIRRALPTKEHLAGFVANIYADLLINDRLQRGSALKMADVYKTLGSDSTDRMWTFYMRIYEVLWRLQKGSLAKGKIDSALEGDAALGARVIRAYGKDWLKGAGRFAALCLPYLMEDEARQMQKILKGWLDTQNAGAGGSPDGLTEIEPDEAEGAIHPALDDELAGISSEGSGEDAEEEEAKKREAIASESGSAGNSRGQYREPFEFGEILKGLGVSLTPHEIAIRYYRERALPYLVKFPSRILPESKEPLIEGLDVWDIGSPLEEVDWFESTIVSPQVIPGVTTVQRSYGTASGSLPEKQPVDLDLYVDCSGSMPNPQVATSYLTLAGAIISLSALRAGSRVKATLWSGAHDYQTTGEFIRDEREILKILTGYIGGWTAFPIHLLRETFINRKPSDRPAHILVISDDGVDTMFSQDEKNNSGWDVSRMALERARGGGTMVLNLWSDWQTNQTLARASKEGWDIHRVQTWEQLVEFARAFSKANYGERDSR